MDEAYIKALKEEYLKIKINKKTGNISFLKDKRISHLRKKQNLLGFSMVIFFFFHACIKWKNLHCGRQNGSKKLSSPLVLLHISRLWGCPQGIPSQEIREEVYLLILLSEHLVCWKLRLSLLCVIGQFFPRLSLSLSDT